MSSLPPVIPTAGGIWDDRLYRDEHRRLFGDDTGYDEFDPAYRYGDATARSEDYTAHEWEAAEPRLRSRWESDNPESSWERFKDSVRFAWDKVRGRT